MWSKFSCLVKFMSYNHGPCVLTLGKRTPEGVKPIVFTTKVGERGTSYVHSYIHTYSYILLAILVLLYMKFLYFITPVPRYLKKIFVFMSRKIIGRRTVNLLTA